VLVGFYKDVSATERRNLNVAATIPGIDISILRVPSGQECAALEMLRCDPRVAFAELDYAVHATEPQFPRETKELVPNDPDWPSQWGLAKIKAPAAWGFATGTADVVIAVLDSGIQLNHQDLVDNLWINPGEVPGNGLDDDGNGKVDDFQGWHFYHEWNGQVYIQKEDNQVADDYGHGTHIAGIAGAKINNGIGIAGMAGGSRLMTVKVLDQKGDGWYSDLVKGIIYAVDNGARIINLSMGGTPSSETLQEAVNYAHAHGVLVVAAAGNDGGAVLYPAACEHALAVAATDQNDAWANSNHSPELDAAAPGMNIYSTGWPGDELTNCASGYCSKSGTSSATPHVAGLAALIWSARLDLTVEQVTDIITTTAADVNSDTFPGRDEYVGWGRIEAGRALSATVHTGNLHLAVSRPQLTVGESAVITATIPPMSGTLHLFTFAASGGTVSPTITAIDGGEITTTLVAGPVTGMGVITGTTGSLTGTLFLRLLPGSTISVTLVPSSWEVASGHSVTMTLTATDSFGNPPLNDGTAVNWKANGGTVTPARSPLYNGVGKSTFTADIIHRSTTITASLGTEHITTVTIDIDIRLCYLPIILQ
jgi:subtilisin family serine protease